MVTGATVITRRLSLEHMPEVLLDYILEYDSSLWANLACCSHTFYDIINRRLEKSTKWAQSFNMPSLKYILPHQDFKCFEGLSFDSSPEARHLAFGLLAAVTTEMFSEDCQLSMLLKAIGNELCKLFTLDRQ